MLPEIRASVASMSPSSRRAWVEIGCRSRCWLRCSVALLAEGVGRNHVRGMDDFVALAVALLAEGVGRNVPPPE